MENITKLSDDTLMKILRAVFDDLEYEDLDDKYKPLIKDAYVTDLIHQELLNRNPSFWYWDIYL